MRRGLAVLTLGLIAGLTWSQEPEKKEDAAVREKLLGTWTGFVVEGRGEKPDAGPIKIEVVITADKITARDLRADRSLGHGTYKLDVSKKVAEIDATGAVGGGRREKPYPGIFELNGDTLRWCVDNQGKTRPTEFASERGRYLLILKREAR